MSAPTHSPTEGGMIVTPEVRADAVRTEARVRRRIIGTELGPRPGLAGMGAVVLLLVASVLVVAQWALYPIGQEPQSNATRSLGLAIVIGFCGLRLLLSAGRHPIASGVAIACGVVMIVAASLAGHEDTSTVVVETLCGVAVVLAAATAMASPQEDPTDVL